MASVLQTCNEALAAISADSIASLDEHSVSARECLRSYQSVVTDMLEGFDWGFAVRRATLAEVPNPRPAEWLYAYAKPADVSSLVRIVPAAGAFPAVGWYYHAGWEAVGAIRYVEDAGTIFTNAATAVLEYTTNLIDPSGMPAMFRRAVVYELAARIAPPIRKERQITIDMMQLAGRWRAEAMADDTNRYPRIDRSYVSEVERVRGGWGPYVALGG